MFKSIIDFVQQSRGKFISVTFTKKDGTIRKLNGRLGVTKYLHGGKCTLNDNFIILWDAKACGYRAVNKDTILTVRSQGYIFTKGNNHA